MSEEDHIHCSRCGKIIYKDDFRFNIKTEDKIEYKICCGCKLRFNGFIRNELPIAGDASAS